MDAPVLGTGREALSVVDRLNRRKPVVEEIIIAMPSAELDRAAGEIAGV